MLPAILTIAVVYFVVTSLKNYIAVPIGEAIKWLILNYSGHDEKYFADAPGFIGWIFRYAPWIGLIVGVILVFVLGALVASFFGKKIWKAVESLLQRLPVVSAVYPYAKQFTDFFSSSEGRPKFKNAVAVPYPSPGLYSLGFITSDGLRHLNEHTGKHMVAVFIPATPTTFAGYLIFVPREEIVPLPISADEAVALVLSFGVVTPQHQSVSVTHLMKRPEEAKTEETKT